MWCAGCVLVRSLSLSKQKASQSIADEQKRVAKPHLALVLQTDTHCSIYFRSCDATDCNAHSTDVKIYGLRIHSVSDMDSYVATTSFVLNALKLPSPCPTRESISCERRALKKPIISKFAPIGCPLMRSFKTYRIANVMLNNYRKECAIIMILPSVRSFGFLPPILLHPLHFYHRSS